jgi:hypothetical protein
LCEALERSVEREEVAGTGDVVCERLVERDEHDAITAALSRVPPPCRLDEHLPHRAGGDAFEVQR